MSFSLCDEIKLISLVAENPCLYDSTIKEFHYGKPRTKAWARIAAQLGKKSDACKKAWQDIRKKYTDAVRRSKLGIGDPATWQSKHHDLLTSFYKIKEQPIQSIYASATPVDVKMESSPNSSKIEWVDGDLNVVESPVHNQLQNGGQGNDERLLPTESRSSEGHGDRYLSETADGVESRSSEGHVVTETADGGKRQMVIETVVGRGYVEERLSRSTAQGQQPERRSSGRVKNKVELNGSVDEDIVATILREEQKLLQQYHRQKGSVGSSVAGNLNTSAKKPRPSSTSLNTSAKKARPDHTSLNTSAKKPSNTSLNTSAKKPHTSNTSLNTSAKKRQSANTSLSTSAKKRHIVAKSKKPVVTNDIDDDDDNDEVVDVDDDDDDDNSMSHVGGKNYSSGGNQNSRLNKDGGGGPQSRNYNGPKSGENLRLSYTQYVSKQQQLSGGNSLRLGGSFDSVQNSRQSDVTAPQQLTNDFDDVGLFCRHIGSVLRRLPPLQKAVAKKDLSSVLSHFEIVAAKIEAGESSAAASNNRCSPAAAAGGWNMVTSTRMEGMSMLPPPVLSFMGGQM